VGFPERAKARPHSHAKKEITMTKSRHKDTAADTVADTVADTATDTDTDTGPDTDTDTGTDADADTGTGTGRINPSKKGTVPFLMSGGLAA
jgi:hypothetical protein